MFRTYIFIEGGKIADWTTKPPGTPTKGHLLIVRKIGRVEVLPFWSDWLFDALAHVTTSLDLALQWFDQKLKGAA